MTFTCIQQSQGLAITRQVRRPPHHLTGPLLDHACPGLGCQESVSASVRIAAEKDRLHQEIALLREELRIKDARMIRGTVSLQRSAPSQSLASQLQRPLQDATYRFSSLLQATLPAPNRRPKIAGPLHLFAVASLTVFLAHPLRETLESELGVLDFRLSLPPSLARRGA